MSKNEGQIFHREGERRAALAQLFDSVAKRPWLTCGLALYWLWFNLTFQSPVLFPSLAITEDFSFPTIAVPITIGLITYFTVSKCFRRTNGLVRKRRYLVILAILMVLGAVANILWVVFGRESAMGVTPLLENVNDFLSLPLSLFFVGAVLIGVVAACLNIEWGRIFGALGPMQAILQSIVGYISASILSFLITFAPHELTLVVSLLVPVPLVLCILKTQKDFPRKQFFDHGLTATLSIPWKFLLTALLHGLCFGALLGLHSVLTATESMVTIALIGYVCAGILLLITVVAVRMDFNHLIYQVGFSLVGIGAFFVILLFPQLEIGSLIQYMGACYLHLLMWGLCAYLTKSFKLPADWVISVSTSCYLLGQLIGIGTSSTLIQLPSGNETVPQLFLVLLLVVLIASNLMLSNRNLRTGWGLVRPGSSELNNDDITVITEFLVTNGKLTNREAEVLGYLVKGWNRRTISEELVVSEETIKSHTRNIYHKLLVNSQQELIALFESSRQLLDD